MKTKKLLAIILSLAMVLSIIPSFGIVANADGKFSVTMELYEFTPPEDREDTTAGKIGAQIVPNENGKLDLKKDQEIVAIVKYNNIATIAPYGIQTMAWEFIYDGAYLTPQYGHEGDVDSTGEGSITDQPDSIVKLNKPAKATKYVLGISDTPYIESEAKTVDNNVKSIIASMTKPRYSTLGLRAQGPNASQIVKSDGALAYLPFTVAQTGETSITYSSENTNCTVGAYNEAGDDLYQDYTAQQLLEQSLMDTPAVYSLNIVAVSNKPKVTANKTYYEDETAADADSKKVGDLKATSTIVVDKLIDSSNAEVAIPADTVINLYKATATVVDNEGTNEIKLTKDGAAIATQTVATEGGTATFTLNTTNDTATTDYIVTATEDGKEESEEVPVVAATATLDVHDGHIKTAYDMTTGNFAANSEVRIYDDDGVDVIDSNLKIMLYSAEDDSLIDTFNTVLTDSENSNAPYISVDLAGKDSSKEYYLIAQYANREKSPSKYTIRKQSYEPLVNSTEEAKKPYNAVVTNNALKTATPDTILIKAVLNESGTVVELATGDTRTFKVYNAAQSGNEITVTKTEQTGEDGFEGILLSLPAGTMTKEGKDLWVTATETDKLESARVKIEAVKAGGEITGLVTTDGTVIGATATLTQADKDKIAAQAGANPVANPYKVPAGTAASKFADYGFKADLTNVPVYLADALEDGTHIAFVTIKSWKNLATTLGDPATLTNDADTNKIVEVEFDSDSMDAANVAVKDDYTPTVNVTITKNPVIDDLADPEDVEEGDNTVPDVIVVPDGTGRDKLADYGLKDTKIAVHFSPAKADGTEIAYIDIEWNTATDLADPIKITDGSNSQDFTLTGSFKQADLTTAGVEASDLAYKPHVTIRVVKDAKVATGVVDPEFNIVPEPAVEPKTVTGDDKTDIETKIASGDAEGFVQVIRVPENTTVADAKAKLPTKKLPVVVKTTNGTTNAVEQSIKYISVTWDTTALPTPDTTKLTVDAGKLTKEYTVTGALNATELASEGITLSGTVDPLTVKLVVGKAPTITLNKGNANDEDITAGRKAEDIFVFRGYTFTDPGLKVTNSDGTTELELKDIPEANIKREINVKGDTTKKALAKFDVTETLSDFTLNVGVDYSKTYELTYTYTDPDTKIEATATRTVYVIYKRGDVDRKGNVGEEIGQLDETVMANHAFKIKYMDLSDPLFLEKTANVDKKGNVGEEVGQLDETVLANHAFKIKYITQDYATNDTTHTMVFTAE